MTTLPLLLSWTTIGMTPSSTGSFVKLKATPGSVQTRKTSHLASLYASLTMVCPFLSNISYILIRFLLGTTPQFRIFPYEIASLEPFETAVAALNPVVAVKVRSAAVHAALAEVCVYNTLSILGYLITTLFQRSRRKIHLCRLQHPHPDPRYHAHPPQCRQGAVCRLHRMFLARCSNSHLISPSS